MTKKVKKASSKLEQLEKRMMDAVKAEMAAFKADDIAQDAYNRASHKYYGSIEKTQIAKDKYLKELKRSI